MGKDGKYIAMVGGVYLGAGNTLSGGGEIGSVVFLGFVGHVRSYDKDGLVNPCNIPEEDPG